MNFNSRAPRLCQPRGNPARSCPLAALLLASLALFVAQAGAVEPVRYSVSLAHRSQHKLQVTAQFDPGDARSLEVRLPAWNALYQVRDFAQYLQGMVCTSANAAVEKIQKSTWRLTRTGPGAIELQYSVYADQPGPFGMQLNAAHAFLNPAQFLVYTDEHRAEPVEIRFRDLPAGWKTASALTERDGVFRARNYDHLADSPFEISEFTELNFMLVRGTYRIVVHAPPETYAMPDLRQKVERIVEHQTGMMRDTPFARFTFFYHFHQGGGGGMEHADCTAIDSVPFKEDPHGELLMGVTAHEFFHVWNVKRIRPAALEPVDYTREQYTRSLWFSEGVTNTYGYYTLLRTGLISRDRYLQVLASRVQSLNSRPALMVQSLEESSLDAWLERYPYYLSPDRSVSYYERGEITGVLLDLAIRNATANRRSLDDVMRYMNEHFAHEGRYFDETSDIQRAVEEVAGASFRPVFELLVRSPGAIPYSRFFEYAGLELREQQRTSGALGFSMKGTNTVERVDEDGPAFKAGVRAGDGVMRINGRKITSPVAPEIGPQSKVKLEVRRGDGTLKIQYEAGTRIELMVFLVPKPGPTPLQQQIREGWLSGTTSN